MARLKPGEISILGPGHYQADDCCLNGTCDTAIGRLVRLVPDKGRPLNGFGTGCALADGRKRFPRIYNHVHHSDVNDNMIGKVIASSHPEGMGAMAGIHYYVQFDVSLWPVFIHCTNLEFVNVLDLLAAV